MKVQRLVVGKGKTSRPSDAEEWEKEYYEIEAVVEDQAELENAKVALKGLLDGAGFRLQSPHLSPARNCLLTCRESSGRSAATRKASLRSLKTMIVRITSSFSNSCRNTPVAA
ncbi:hypothetical protein MUO79_02890 [Candidatus Bathyarchaeota archaeon]|nr:hypothetical protein [Candidatus Bathyarchaeota archaeon]